MAGVRYLAPAGAITPTGTWSLGARAGDFVFVAGMRGIDPATNSILGTEEERIRRAYTNMKTIAESEGASLASCVRLTVFVTDMKRLRPLVNKVQEELWAGGPYPPRTIVEVAKLNQDDIFEVEGTFYAPKTARFAAIPQARMTQLTPSPILQSRRHLRAVQDDEN